jgi:hypothetical protein
MRIDEQIEESGWYDFCDGYLGSTNHCVGYYYHYDDEDINEIKDEGYLMSRDLCEEDWDWDYDEEEKEYNKFFDKWFSECNDFDIIPDYNENSKFGYGKIIIDKVNRSIKIMVVPTLIDMEGNEKLIFGFNSKGKLIRIINEVKLNKLLKSGWDIN